jgi:hypothetical protein
MTQAVIIGIAIGYPLGKFLNWAMWIALAPITFRVNHWHEARQRRIWEATLAAEKSRG